MDVELYTNIVDGVANGDKAVVKAAIEEIIYQKTADILDAAPQDSADNTQDSQN